MTENSNHALEAKKQQVAENEIKDSAWITSSGDKIKTSAVPFSVYMAILSKIKDPLPPVEMDEDLGRKVPNFNNPEYLRELSENSQKRSDETINIAVLFGVELVDGVPPKEKWLNRLLFSQRITGEPNLDSFNLEDKIDLEFIYKKFVALASIEDINKILMEIGISAEKVEKADESFRGDTESE